MFENVTFTFYKEELKGVAIGDEETFDRYARDNKIYVKTLILDGIITQDVKSVDIDTAVCFMAEVDYLTAKEQGREKGEENDVQIASESIGSYSYTVDNSQKAKSIEQNYKSADSQKAKYLRLYCNLRTGLL